MVLHRPVELARLTRQVELLPSCPSSAHCQRCAMLSAVNDEVCVFLTHAVIVEPAHLIGQTIGKQENRHQTGPVGNELATNILATTSQGAVV